MYQTLTQTSTPNFIDEDGNVYLVRCPKCNKENYSAAVAAGICVWCGFNGNENNIIIDRSTEH